MNHNRLFRWWRILACAAATAELMNSAPAVLPRMLTSPEKIGNITVPAGSYTWKSATTKWSGVFLSQPLPAAEFPTAVGSLLIFDDKTRLRTIKAPTKAPDVDCRFYSETGSGIPPPSYPKNAVPKERQFLLQGTAPDTPLGRLPDAMAAEMAKSSASLVSLSVGQGQPTVLTAAVAVGGIGLPPGTFIQPASQNGTGTDYALIEYGVIGGIQVPLGTCLHLAGIKDSASLLSRSPVELPFDIATIAPASYVYWNDDLRPQSYLISKPITFGQTSFPALTQMGSFFPGITTVRPPDHLIVGGVPIDSTAFTSFSGTELMETWVAEDWQYSPTKRIPKGTHVVFSSGNLYRADLSNPTVLDGITLIKSTFFYPNGIVKYSVLSSPARILQVDCAPGELSSFEDGRLEGCMLSHPQSISGIRLRTGKFEIDASGQLVSGTLDQDLTIGDTTLHPGSILNGMVDGSSTLTLVDAQGVSQLEKDVVTQLDELLPTGLLALKAHGGPFGSFLQADIKLQSGTLTREPHAFVAVRKYSIRNFLKNPPFADCDSRIELTAELRWRIDQRTNQLIVTSGLRSGSQVLLETNVCPVTDLALSFLRLIDPFLSIPAGQKDVIRQKLTSVVSNKQKALLELLTDTEHILPYTVRVQDLFMEQNELRMNVHFSRRLK